MATRPTLSLALTSLLLATFVQACGDDGEADDSGSDGDSDTNTDTDGDSDTDTDSDGEVDSDCLAVRLTSYTASSGGWCEFDRTLPVLPAFVQQGMTTAIAEPWNGGSHQGNPGEACGECWEVHSHNGSQLVMVHDLCPIAGNPLCAGGHFHFDLSSETQAAIGGGGLDGGYARRVPCPVQGNIHIQVNDWNEWGYVRLQFVNHRIAVRAADIKYASNSTWYPLERSGGAWHSLDHPTPAEGDTIVFRLTSAQGEILETTNPIPFYETSETVFDSGVQFTDQAEEPDSECVYTPPMTVYGDGWGGIDEVRWMPNPWGGETVEESATDCYLGSSSCLLVRKMEQWSGMHIYHRQSFETSNFASLELGIRAEQGHSGTVTLNASFEGASCTEKNVDVTEEWTQVSFDIQSACTGVERINTITVQNLSPEFDFLLDEIRFSGI